MECKQINSNKIENIYYDTKYLAATSSRSNYTIIM